MAYVKTEWKARQGTGLNRFRKSREDEEFIYLDNEPEQITEQGTSFSTERMNNIEDGICDAHKAVFAEIQARIQGDENSLIGALEAINTHNGSGEAHENLFAQTVKNSAMGASGGVATLDSMGKVPVNQLPAEVAGDLTGILEAVDEIDERNVEQAILHR
jgi:hypothetical protein